MKTKTRSIVQKIQKPILFFMFTVFIFGTFLSLSVYTKTPVSAFVEKEIVDDKTEDQKLEEKIKIKSFSISDTGAFGVIDLSKGINQNENKNIKVIKNEVNSRFLFNYNRLQKHVNKKSSNLVLENSKNEGFVNRIKNIFDNKSGSFDDKKVSNENLVKFVPDNIFKKPEDVEMWRNFHRQRVDYLQNQIDLPSVALEKARFGRDIFEEILLDKGFISHKFGDLKSFEESRIKIISLWFKKTLGYIMPKSVHAFFFSSEDFEVCGSLPCSFDIDDSWGNIINSLDSTSKISGAKSLKVVVSGEGGGGLLSSGYDTGEIYTQFKVFIPDTMSWGSSGYFNILRFNDVNNSNLFRLTVEDWGTARLTMAGSDLPWTDTGIDLVKGAVNTIEVRFKKGSLTGDVDIWLNNTTEESPNYSGSGSLNTGVNNVDRVGVGVVYSPDAISTTYYDNIIINDSFIGADTFTNNAPIAPSLLLVNGQINPVGVTDTALEFSAIFNDIDNDEIATHYQIQVSTTSNFASTYWDTGSTTLASSTPKNTRIADISYSGNPLASSTTYYWRIKFWDNDGAEGAWSTTTSTFTVGTNGGNSLTFYSIYDDEIRAGWNNYSWNVDTNLNNENPVYEGMYSAEVSYMTAWGGFSYNYDSIDSAPFNSLEMAVNVGNNTAVDLYLYFATTSALEVVPIEYYIPGGFSSNTWHLVSIPLYDLGLEDFSGEATFNIESSQAVTVYYDDIKFVGVSTSTNNNPLAPTSLQTEGQINPINLINNTPKFSAIYNDVDLDDVAEYYQIQVDTNSYFSSVWWDSSKTALGVFVSEGHRSEDISYSGNPLASSTTYYWRIKFWDDDGAEGAWSSLATFSLADENSIQPLVIYDDFMASGWNNWSYGGTFTENSTEQVFSGVYAIKAVYTESYGGLFPRNGNLTTVVYDNVKFDIFIESGSNINLVFGAFDNNSISNLGYIDIKNYLPGNTFTLNEWKTVTIPLEDINANNLLNEDIGFYFESENPATVFFDNIKLTKVGVSSTNTPPTAPTSLQTEGQTNPVNITDVLPEFSAMYNDDNPGDFASNYRIQVDDDFTFSSPVWDSGKSSMLPIVAGFRTRDISYSGNPLASSTTYYWRIKFWDDDGAEGVWSNETATFSVVDYEAPVNNLPSDLRLNNILNDPAQKILLHLVNSLTASGSVPSNDPISDTSSLATFLGQTAHVSSSAYASTTNYLNSVKSVGLGDELKRLQGLLSVSTSTWDLLKSDIFDLQNLDGGFGYVSAAPSDIETTLAALDLFSGMGDLSDSAMSAVVYVLDQIDNNGRVWYPNGSTASYYLMNRTLQVLRFYNAYSVTDGINVYDISEKTDLIINRLVSELDTETFYLSGSNDDTESLMTYLSLKESGKTFSWLKNMRDVLISRNQGVHTDIFALRAFASSEIDIVATPQTSNPANGEPYVIGLEIENTGLDTPQVLVAHIYVGEYLVGSVNLATAKPESGQVKYYNLNLPSGITKKFLGNMNVRVFVETDDLYPGLPDGYWTSYIETFAENSNLSVPALPLWWSVQEHINTFASSTGIRFYTEFLDDSRRDGWAFAYRVSGTETWSYIDILGAPSGVLNISVYGLTEGKNYDVSFGATSDGVLYMDRIETVRIPYLNDDIVQQQPFLFKNVFSSVYDYVMAFFVETEAFGRALVGTLEKTFIINSLRGNDTAYINLSDSVAPLRQSFTTNSNTTSTSTPFSLHTFVFPDNDPPEGVSLSISGLIGGDVLYSNDYYAVTPTATDNRSVQYFDFYLRNTVNNEEEYIGTTYNNTFDFYVGEELENGDYRLGMTAIDFRGNVSEMYYTSEFEVISNPINN